VRITVDVDRCVGAGQCVLTAPDIFDQNEDGVVVLLVPEPDDRDEAAVRQARMNCPSGTIALFEG